MLITLYLDIVLTHYVYKLNIISFHIKSIDELIDKDEKTIEL